LQQDHPKTTLGGVKLHETVLLSNAEESVTKSPEKPLLSNTEPESVAKPAEKPLLSNTEPESVTKPPESSDLDSEFVTEPPETPEKTPNKASESLLRFPKPGKGVSKLFLILQ